LAILPQLNNATIDARRLPVAVVDDESLKKIVSADRKTFSSTISTNTKKITTPIQEVFTSFQETTKTVWDKIYQVLEYLLKETIHMSRNIEDNELIARRNDTLKKLNDEETESESGGKGKKEGADPKKNEKTGLFDGLKSSLGFDVGDFFGSLLGTSMGKGLLKVLKAPIGFTFGLIRNPLAIAVLAIGNELVNAFEDEKNIEAMSGDPSKIANIIGRFFGGSVKNNFASKFAHYSAWAGMGVIIGAVGGPVGMLAGAIIGAALGAVADLFGPNVFADLAQLTIDKFSGILQAFKLKAFDPVENQKRIAQIQATLADDEKKLDENITKLTHLQQDLNQALKDGDTKRAAGIQAEIDKINAENFDINNDLGLEGAKLAELQNQALVASQKTVIGRFTAWIDQYTGTGVVDITVGDLIDESVDMIKNSWLGQGINKIIQAVGRASDLVVNSFVAVYTDMENRVSGIWETTKTKTASMFGDTATKIIKYLDSQIDAFFGIFSEFFDHIKNWFADTFSWTNFQNWWYGQENAPTPQNMAIHRKIEENIAPTVGAGAAGSAGHIMSNLFTETVKRKTIEITQTLKRGEETPIDKMLKGMATVQNNNNSSTVTTNVQQKTNISKPLSTANPAFSGYMRGE
jgi:hypothetical protein